MHAMKTPAVGIIGVGGFAATHIESALRCSQRGMCALKAVVARLPHDPAQREAEREEELRRLGVRVYRSIEEMLAAERGRLDVVTVPLGIALHAPVSIAALKAGFHVLCEKPAAGSTADSRKMLEAQRNSERFLSIGYQHLLSPAIQELKRSAVRGRFGRLLEARTIVQWPRDCRYYTRNAWAGRLVIGGRPVLDSPMQNAAAHFLQNMLYVAGDSHDTAAWPAEIYAENYRANAIESADTQFARIVTDTAVTITFVASHAVRMNQPPYSEFRFERATVAWDPERGTRVVGGSWELPGTPGSGFDGLELHDYPLADLLHAVAGGRAPRSSIENAVQHVASVEGAFTSSGGVHAIPRECVVVEEGRLEDSSGAPQARLTVVQGLEDILMRCFETGQGPAELGVEWACPGRRIPTTP